MNKRLELRLRHANYYLDRLKAASDLYLTGGQNVEAALMVFDTEWPQIDLDWKWAGENDNPEGLRLCSDFARIGTALIDIRQNPLDCIHRLELSLNAAQKLQDDQAVASHLSHLGLNHADMGDLEKARDCYQEALSVIPKSNENDVQQIKCRIHIGLGAVCAYLDLKHEALNHFTTALNLAQSCESPRDEASALNHIGDLYLRSQSVERAIGSFQQALQLMQQTHNQRGEAHVLGNLGNAYLAKSNASRFYANQAVEYFQQSLGRYRGLNDKRGQMHALGMLGDIYRRWQQYQQALNFSDEALELARQLGDKPVEAVLLFNRSLHYEETRQIERAFEFAERSLCLFNELKMSENARQAKEQVNRLKREIATPAWWRRPRK